MLKNRKKVKFNLKKSFLILGIILILLSIIGRTYESTELSFFASTSKTENQIEQEKPNFSIVSIPEQNIELSVKETKIKNGVWQISDGGASLLDSATFPKTEGKYIIYAHNTLDKFGKIVNLKAGSRIYLVSKSGQILKYEVTATEIVNPNQVEVLTEKSNNTLILYTCTGFLDSKRFVVKATPKA